MCQENPAASVSVSPRAAAFVSFVSVCSLSCRCHRVSRVREWVSRCMLASDPLHLCARVPQCAFVRASAAHRCALFSLVSLPPSSLVSRVSLVWRRRGRVAAEGPLPVERVRIVVSLRVRQHSVVRIASVACASCTRPARPVVDACTRGSPSAEAGGGQRRQEQWDERASDEGGREHVKRNAARSNSVHALQSQKSRRKPPHTGKSNTADEVKENRRNNKNETN